MQNKEIIIEELRNKVDACYDAGKDYYPHSLEGIKRNFEEFLLSKLTQAYNEGARDMVERITRDILDYNLAGALPRSQEGLEILLENLKKEYEL